MPNPAMKKVRLISTRTTLPDNNPTGVEDCGKANTMWNWIGQKMWDDYQTLLLSYQDL